ncbi:MAG TPA: FHA domain-containing protein [Vicinamibacterales bacterium]|nr:FHA domain-containing protein [Vicinamibacterales bacterium]
MNLTAPATRIARFGVFDLDPRTGELRKRGLRVHLQEQPFQVLTLLVERAGDLVTREELQKRLWSDSVFVDFDQGLNKAVLKIRLALGDSAESPRFVETLERRGYRFIANVDWLPAGQVPGEAPRLPQPIVARLTMGDRTFALAEGAHVIGRDPSAAVWIDATVVSRNHAVLVVRRGVLTVEDLGSRNGTFVNRARVSGVVTLSHGDEIRIGTIPLSLHVSSGRTRTVLVAGEATPAG